MKKLTPDSQSVLSWIKDPIAEIIGSPVQAECSTECPDVCFSVVVCRWYQCSGVGCIPVSEG